MALNVKYKTELTEDEKEQIIKNFLPFIKYTAYRMAWRLPPQLDADDLVSVGIMGLLDALSRYEKGKAKLKTFVEFRIKGAMLDELRAHDWIPKSMRSKLNAIKKTHLTLERELGRPPESEEVAERLEISIDEYRKILQNANLEVSCRFEDFSEKMHEESAMDITECIADPNIKTPSEIYENNKKNETLARLIEKLPEKERLILSLYYWEELTMKEIGKILNLTEGRVCQLHNKAIIMLKAKLDADYKA